MGDISRDEGARMRVFRLVPGQNFNVGFMRHEGLWVLTHRMARDASEQEREKA